MASRPYRQTGRIHPLSIRVREGYKQRLEKLAEKRGVPMGHVVEQGIELLEKQKIRQGEGR